MIRPMSLPLVCSLALLVVVLSPAPAQQVDCTVQVNYEAVATTHKDLLTDFERDVRDYVNNYAWGNETLEQKIRCTLNIFIKGATGENSYSAQVFIGSQRPIFGSDRNSAVLRLLDETWEFTYLHSRPLNHNLMQFGDLTSFLDYAMMLVIGSDYDTYEPMGGTKFFRTAADIANLGRSSGAKGWDVKAGSFSRLQLIDEILSPKAEPMRRAIYHYHFSGLDSLAINPDAAYAGILRALETIGRTRRQVDARNLFLKTFFEAKYMEIAEIFQSYPDRSVYDRLARIDPSHTAAYTEAQNRQR